MGKYTLSRSGSNRMNQDQTGSECRPGQDPGDHLMFGCSGETSFDVVLKSCQDSQESVSSKFVLMVELGYLKLATVKRTP